MNRTPWTRPVQDKNSGEGQTRPPPETPATGVAGVDAFPWPFAYTATMAPSADTLRQILLSEKKRPAVAEDCVRLVDSEVAAKSGLGGLAVKGAYGIVKKIKPGIIYEAVDRLLDEFVAKLEPYYAEFQGSSRQGLVPFFEQRRAAIAGSLLSVTDERMARAKNRTIKKAYGKLRPVGQKHVEAAVPGIGRVVHKHTS